MAGPLVGDGSATDRPGAPARVFRTELNPVDLLARAASMYAAKTAVVHGARRYSYAELGERAWRLANALRAAGLRKGIGSRRSSRTARRCWKRTSASLRPAASS